MAKPKAKQKEYEPYFWLGSFVFFLVSGVLLLVSQTLTLGQGSLNQSSISESLTARLKAESTALKELAHKKFLEDVGIIPESGSSEALKDLISKERIQQSVSGFFHDISEVDTLGINMAQERSDQLIVTDLKEEGSVMGSSLALTPEERINKRVALEKWVSGYEREYQKIFVESFIKNARKDGLFIRVNADLDIVEIQSRPVSRPLLFSNSRL